MNIQRENIDLPEIMLEDDVLKDYSKIDISNKLNDLSLSISSCKRPLILLGRGIKSSFSKTELEFFLQITKIPVVTTLLAIDTLDSKSLNILVDKEDSFFQLNMLE